MLLAPNSSLHSSEHFGTIDGQPIDRVTLKNPHGMSLSVLNYGGIVQSILAPDSDGNMGNVVLGFSTLPEYIDHSPYFGAIVGRYANRIAGGRFVLDGHAYQIPVNDGPNSLHGGSRGFDKRVWRIDHDPELHPETIVLRYTSADGEEGYPGNIEISVTYTIRHDINAFSIDYRAMADAATVINLSNHSYFNLSGEGSGDILKHVLQLRASQFLPVDSFLIPTGELAPVAHTPFDFTEAHVIGERIDRTDDQQLAIAGGYDHCWVFDDVEESSSRNCWRARVIDPASGRVMDIQTDQPGVQFYTGNFLDGSFAGTSGRIYERRSGFCLETQHFPDSPNQSAFPSTTLRPGVEFRSYTTFVFSTLPRQQG